MGEAFSRQEALDLMMNPPAAATMLAGLSPAVEQLVELGMPQAEALAALGLGKR